MILALGVPGPAWAQSPAELRSWGPAGPPVRVLLFETESDLTVRGPAGGPVRLAPGPGGTVLWAGRPRSAAVGLTGTPGSRPLEVFSGSAEAWRVRGDLEVARTATGLAVVNRLPIEDYLVATVGAEMSPKWEIEALRAQAVASRTYALRERRIREAEAFDLRADTASQRYAGLDAEAESVREAVRTTRCEVVVWHGEPILAAFHSASGGRTASAEEVWGRPISYLVSRDVEGEDDSPDTYWRIELDGATLGRALAGAGFDVGWPRRLRVADRSPSGRVARIEVDGDAGRATLSGRDLRQAIGESVLRSTLFQVRPTGAGDRFVFAGTGHGHGVGMSQWGARAMAAEGARYPEILAAFYPGADLARCEPSRDVARRGGRP